MFEDTEDPKLPESPGASINPPDSGNVQETSQPETPATGTESQLPEETHRPKRTTDYLKEIRRKLADEEADQSKSKSGGLFRRITGPLRKVTGPLSTPPPPPSEESKPADEKPLPEIADDFLTDRLSSATAAETSSLLPVSWEEPPVSPPPTEDLLEIGTAPGQTVGDKPETVLGDNEPITLLDNGAIAALGRAEEASAQAVEPDWMQEIRAEAAREAAQAQKPGEKSTGSKRQTDPLSREPAASPKITGQLRDFISSILRRPEEIPPKNPNTELTDDLVTGRLELSLGSETAARLPAAEAAQDASVEAPDSETNLDEQFSAFFNTTHSLDHNELAEPPVGEERDSFLEGLDMNFGRLGEGETGEEIEAFELYPEDEALLWGETGQPAVDQTLPETPPAPDDLWKVEPDPYAYGSDLRRQIWGIEEESEPPAPEILPSQPEETPVSDDAYAAAFLAGADYEVKEDLEERTEAQPEPVQPEHSLSVDDLRSIALEDYQEGGQDLYEGWRPKIDWGDEEAKTSAVPAAETNAVQPEQKPSAEQAWTREKAGPAADWKNWLATRQPVQKFLLVEAVIVGVVLLVAVPFFIFMIIRGSAKPAAQLTANTLPTYLPHPTGMTLPGGWYFTLGKSTITNGQWRPVTSEWLEGTELRRVVALPWNIQTEAVVKTFKPGDPVDLYLNNNNILKYKITSIERVPVDDTQIYSDRISSLVIILFKEKEPVRWVVVCKP